MKTISYSSRANFAKNEITKKLFLLMQEKKSNLALSADVTTSKKLLELAEKCGPEICVLKTHIDIIEDFSFDLLEELQYLAKKHQFLLFEDRKFADIGHTVKNQYQNGIYKIASWADLITAHGLAGPGMIAGLAQIGLPLQRGVLLLAQMSSSHNLLDETYTQKILTLAEQFPEFVAGFIAQKKLIDQPGWIYFTPGVQFNKKNDAAGQNYITPEQAFMENKTDIIIVGRGITQAENPAVEAKRYRIEGWEIIQRCS